MMMLSNLSRVRLFRLLHFCSLFFLAPAIFGQKRIVMTTEGVQ